MFLLDYFDVLPIIETMSLSYLQIKVRIFGNNIVKGFNQSRKKDENFHNLVCTPVIMDVWVKSMKIHFVIKYENSEFFFQIEIFPFRNGNIEFYLRPNCVVI